MALNGKSYQRHQAGYYLNPEGRELLLKMPLHRVRQLDIETAEEQRLVQEIVNIKFRTLPVKKVVGIKRDIDIGWDKTTKTEAEYQAEIDSQVGAERAKLKALTDEGVSIEREAEIEARIETLEAQRNELTPVETVDQETVEPTPEVGLPQPEHRPLKKKKAK